LERVVPGGATFFLCLPGLVSIKQAKMPVADPGQSLHTASRNILGKPRYR
jgi:hypothetical protein